MATSRGHHFSSRGPDACDGGVYPEVVAPAVNVRTSDLTFGGLFPDSYLSVTGTSFAAPHVSGGIALLLGAFPDSSVDDVQSALETAALDLGTSGSDDDYGHGLIDLVAAHAALSEVPNCSDGDADGYFAEGGCGTPLDCHDEDPSINPAACDVKRDGIDQDCDGVDRRGGKPCQVGGESPWRCGLGVELTLLLPALVWLHRRRDPRSASPPS
jgi:bacillopeptidase F